jgi:hypothetical protein
VGDAVDAFQGGESVMAVTRFGSHAELVTLDAHRVMRLPARMSFEEGAAPRENNSGSEQISITRPHDFILNQAEDLFDPRLNDL